MQFQLVMRDVFKVIQIHSGMDRTLQHLVVVILTSGRGPPLSGANRHPWEVFMSKYIKKKKRTLLFFQEFSLEKSLQIKHTIIIQ